MTMLDDDNPGNNDDDSSNDPTARVGDLANTEELRPARNGTHTCMYTLVLQSMIAYAAFGPSQISRKVKIS